MSHRVEGRAIWSPGHTPQAFPVTKDWDPRTTSPRTLCQRGAAVRRKTITPATDSMMPTITAAAMTISPFAR